MMAATLKKRFVDWVSVINTQVFKCPSHANTDDQDTFPALSASFEHIITIRLKQDRYFFSCIIQKIITTSFAFSKISQRNCAHFNHRDCMCVKVLWQYAHICRSAAIYVVSLIENLHIAKRSFNFGLAYLGSLRKSPK